MRLAARYTFTRMLRGMNIGISYFPAEPSRARTKIIGSFTQLASEVWPKTGKTGNAWRFFSIACMYALTGQRRARPMTWFDAHEPFGGLPKTLSSVRSFAVVRVAFGKSTMSLFYDNTETLTQVAESAIGSMRTACNSTIPSLWIYVASGRRDRSMTATKITSYHHLFHMSFHFLLRFQLCLRKRGSIPCNLLEMAWCYIHAVHLVDLLEGDTLAHCQN
jgi:hypothetical protein